MTTNTLDNCLRLTALSPLMVSTFLPFTTGDDDPDTIFLCGNRRQRVKLTPGALERALGWLLQGKKENPSLEVGVPVSPFTAKILRDHPVIMRITGDDRTVIVAQVRI